MENKRSVSTLIPYFIKDGKVRVFLQRRSKDAEYRPDQFGLFGGGIEPGETREQALVREIKEELNIEAKNYEFIGQYESDSVINNVFIMEVGENFENEVHVNEGQYGRYFTEEEIMNEPALSDFHRKRVRDLYDKIKKIKKDCCK